ncbi:MAG: FAD/NAD(P)-binding oxidoreductase [Candidatus Auribacterota bacterium]|nr:FAD/NAD(P)-binding oxidoreductase [Candidatus Auribacterota bacterium]
MGRKTDILIIGADPTGIVCAMTARKYYPEKKITVMKDIEKGVVPCGIPYMFASLESPDENKLGTNALEENGIKMIINQAKKINRDKKQ